MWVWAHVWGKKSLMCSLWFYTRVNSLVWAEFLLLRAQQRGRNGTGNGARASSTAPAALLGSSRMGMANWASQAMHIVFHPWVLIVPHWRSLWRSGAVWSIDSAHSALNGSVQTSPLDPFCLLMVFLGDEVCVCAEWAGGVTRWQNEPWEVVWVQCPERKLWPNKASQTSPALL